MKVASDNLNAIKMQMSSLNSDDIGDVLVSLIILVVGGRQLHFSALPFAYVEVGVDV